MLETTFCPNCGKPYDVSLGECPVCARRRAAEEAKRNAQAKARKGAKKNKKGKPQKPKPVLPTREVDEPTVAMDAEAIRRAEEEARVMAGQRAQQQNGPAEQTAPVQPAPTAPEEMEPETGEEGINKKLLIAVIAAALVLVLIVAGIGRTLSSNTAFRHGQDNPTTAATSVEEKEEKPSLPDKPADKEPAPTPAPAEPVSAEPAEADSKE
jgi:hypothetical protein